MTDAATELHRCVLRQNSDAVEFCDDEKRFLVGAYELDEAVGTFRGGSLTLFDTTEISFEELSTIEAPAGVLDIKFLPTKRDCFVLPLANGSVQYGRVKSENSIELSGLSETLPSEVTLSVSCHSDEVVSAAYSSGSLRRFQIAESEVKLLSTQNIHDHEAWAVLAFEDGVLSGGDDCTIRISDESGSRVMRRFGAGVTAIERDVEENGILVGTYEDIIYKFDVRQMKTPTVEKNLGGGIWRIKANPWNSRYLAVAGMYAGAFVVERETLETVAFFDRHESMCYGISWRDTQRMITCSFYDKLVAMWETGIKD